MALAPSPLLVPKWRSDQTHKPDDAREERGESLPPPAPSSDVNLLRVTLVLCSLFSMAMHGTADMQWARKRSGVAAQATNSTASEGCADPESLTAAIVCRRWAQRCCFIS